MDRARILIAGIGNIFLGDDAFGVEVARRLARRPLADDVRVVDFGIRGIDLTYALLDRYEAVVLVDAAPRGGPPGTLYVLEPVVDETADAEPEPPMLEMHSLDPLKVMRLTRSMGGEVGRILLVGCEPQTTGDDEAMSDGLSEPVEAAVDEAVGLIESLIAKLRVDQSVIANDNLSCRAELARNPSFT